MITEHDFKHYLSTINAEIIILCEAINYSKIQLHYKLE